MLKNKFEKIIFSAPKKVFNSSYRANCMSKQVTIGEPSSKWHNDITFVCEELIPSFIPQVKYIP
jgi:hypothetical protein